MTPEEKKDYWSREIEVAYNAWVYAQEQLSVALGELALEAAGE